MKAIPIKEFNSNLWDTHGVFNTISNIQQLYVMQKQTIMTMSDNKASIAKRFEIVLRVHIIMIDCNYVRCCIHRIPMRCYRT